MQTTTKPISPKKRYILRILELAKNDPQIAALIPKETVLANASAPNLSYDKVMATFLNGYAGRPALGTRKYEIKTEEGSQKQVRSYLPDYEMTSYFRLHKKIKAVSMAWQTHPFCRVEPEEFVCIMGFASLDFAVLDLACGFAKAVTVPLQSSTSGADLEEIFSNIQPVVLATTLNDLPLAAEHAAQESSIKTLVVFNYDKRVTDEKTIFENAKLFLEKADTQIISLNELIEFGEKQEFSFLPERENEAEKMAAIIHSSGSTGKPKGAVISTRALINNWIAPKKMLPRLTVIMAPMNHFMGRINIVNALNSGGTAFFTLKPDLSTLFEDIRLARPVFLSFFPRVFELIYQYFQNEVTRRLKNKNDDREKIEAEVMAEMRANYLGNRLLFGIVGSAPTSPKVQKFIRDCFDILLMEGYGNTEAGSGGLAIDGRINREVVIDYKLKDVPELGYFITDKPFPRGELCVKTKFGVQQYYKQPKATAGLNDETGYNLTGDIVEERGPDQIVIIDRRKDVLKLSQGEYVAVGPLGTVFEAGSAAIKQIYVYGNSHRSYLLAVVVPEMEVVEKVLGEGFSEIKLKNLIRGELQKVGQKEGLKSFEIPRDFIVEHEPFSQKNGLLSSVRKRLRPALKRKYGAALEALYEKHDQIQEAEITALKDPNSELSTEEKLIKILESNLGYQDFEKVEPRTFNELGGDSLGAALLSMSIDEIFGVSIGADVILSPKGNIRNWAELIENAQNQDFNQPTFNIIHGKGAEKVEAKDLVLEKFIDKNLIENAPKLPILNQPPKTVLLTGGNGFLGHILCFKWLEKLSQNDGKLICLVRAIDNGTAKKRLDKKFIGLDLNFESRYKKLAENHLEVLAGDIAEPNLGLDNQTYQKIAKSVDRICHPAALVNHRLGYPHLFRPNIVGTAEIIKFAITEKQKIVDFISTVGVQSLIDKSNGNTESSPLKSVVKLSNHYASGYATSKWAAEYLLQKAYQKLGLPINIFRCDMILPDSNYHGQINAEDMLSRLIYSVIITGLAPSSFYQFNADGTRAKAHYDGIPVDVLSDVIIEISEKKQTSFCTFNAHNYLKDNVSLDSFVDWMETAGYKIHRIDNHQEWFERMETKLKSLPEEQRRHSMIDLMAAFRHPFPTNLAKADCQNFKELAREANQGKEIPNLSENYFHKYLRDMANLGLIKIPKNV